jgi:hypothetical protein
MVVILVVVVIVVVVVKTIMGEFDPPLAGPGCSGKTSSACSQREPRYAQIT